MTRNHKKGYLFIAPFVIVFLVFNIYPIILTLYLSFTNYTGLGGVGNADMVGFTNYIRLFSDTYFYKAFYNTIVIWGGGFIIQLGVALGLAMIFSDIRLKMKGVGVFRALYYLPNIITIASVALLFGILLDWNHGALNQMLLSLGLIDSPVNWLNEPKYAQSAVALINAWMWFGNSFIILLAGISGISREYFEAALIDGANWWQSFTRVTLPQLKPILLYVLITSIIGGLQMFDLPMLLTDTRGAPDGSLNTMVLYMYNQAFKYDNFAYASTIAYGLFLITVVFSFITFRTMYRKNVE